MTTKKDERLSPHLESYSTAWSLEQMTKRAMDLASENVALRDLVRALTDQNAVLREHKGLPFEGFERATSVPGNATQETVTVVGVDLSHLELEPTKRKRKAP